MDLFDDIPRTNHRVPRAEETKFGYLNMSARPEAGAVRAFLVQCLERYPEEHREDLIKRLRSIDTNHDAAVFELIVHELLVRTGHRIVAVEPRIEGRTTSPDFLVEAPDGTEFVVECVVASGRSDAQASGQKRLATAIDAVSATPSPRHYLAVDVRGEPNAPVSLKALRKGLEEWIGTLPNGDAAARRVRPFVFEQHGLQLRISAMISRRNPPKPDDRSVGSISYGIRGAQPGEDLRASLLKKANRYGDLQKPYVIAVNGTGVSAGERDLLDALLGSPIAIVRRYEGDEAHVEAGRAGDGVWTDGRRARKRGVSAVLSFDGASSWRPWGRSARLIRNPWANHPLPEIPVPLPQLNPGDGEFVKVSGQEGPALFELGDEWPE